MEIVTKLILLSQSDRSKTFMFYYRILMAAIMTNYNVTKIGFQYTGAEISLKTVYCFVSSNEFLLVLGLYLFYVFIFFWSCKIIVVMFRLYCSSNVFTKDKIVEKLIIMKVIKYENEKLVFVTELMELSYNSVIESYTDEKKIDKIFDTMSNILSVILSTSVVYFTVNNSKLFLPSWIGNALNIVSFLALFLVFCITFVITKFIYLPKVRLDINN